MQRGIPQLQSRNQLSKWEETVPKDHTTQNQQPNPLFMSMKPHLAYYWEKEPHGKTGKATVLVGNYPKLTHPLTSIGWKGKLDLNLSNHLDWSGRWVKWVRVTVSPQKRPGHMSSSDSVPSEKSRTHEQQWVSLRKSQDTWAAVSVPQKRPGHTSNTQLSVNARFPSTSKEHSLQRRGSGESDLHI